MTTTTTSLDHSTTSPLQKAIWIAAGMMLVVIASVAFSQAWSANAAPGDDDATYVPIPNCRAFDFRPGESPAGGKKTPLGPGETYEQQITGAVGDCTIPSSAVGVAMNVTVANGTAQSNLRVYPGDVVTVPTVSNLNWLPGDSPTPNKVDVKLSPTGTINIYNQNGNVDVIGDIAGYYTSETLQELNQSVGLLLESRPFVESNTIEPNLLTLLTNVPTSRVSVSVTAPVAGQVTVDSRAVVGHAVAGGDTFCYINDTEAADDRHQQRFEADDNANFGTLAGSRVFDIAQGETKTFHLVCRESIDGGTMDSRTLTAMFTPAKSL
ncbi:MAG: hypothetical protein AAGF73_18900 [Actinomycetota bacterium]